MITIFIKVFTIFIIAAIGFIANKANVLTLEANKYFTNLLLYITLPCMIIGSITSNELSQETLKSTAEVAIGTIIYIFITWGIGLIIVKFLSYEPKEDKGIMLVLFCGLNTGFMGFPITYSIFGDTAFYFMVIQNCTFGLYYYFIQILQLHYGSRTKVDLKSIIKSFCNLCMLATFIGFTILFTGIRVAPPVSELLKLLGDATTPVSMILLGIQLANSDLKGAIKNNKLFAMALANVLLVPVITFLICNWLPITNWAKMILVFSSAFPGAILSVPMSEREGKNSSLMAEGVSLTILMSMITLPIASMVISRLYM